MIRSVLLTALLCASVELAAQSKPKPKPLNWGEQQELQRERALKKAMDKDGLGSRIEITGPFVRSGRTLDLDRVTYEPPTWGHTEMMGDAGGPWVDKLEVSWEAHGDSAGRLRIVFSSPSYLCTLTGDIAVDRITVTGIATCGGSEQPFTARIVRP